MRYIYMLFLFLTSCSLNKLEKAGVYKEVKPADFLVYIKAGNVNIIDVRTREEFIKTHIEGAVNASYLSGHFSDLVDSLNLRKDIPTLIYCETQHRSLPAAQLLFKAGFYNIIDLDKGMMNWRKKGFPYISDNVK